MSELVSVRTSDIDFDAARIWVKRVKDGLSTNQPLQGNELRALRGYLRTRKDNLPWLFLSSQGGQMTRQNMNYIIKQAGAKAGLGHGTRICLDGDGDEPRREAASLISVLNKSLLGALQLDIDGFEKERDTVDVLVNVLRAAGVTEISKVPGVVPMEECPGCGAPVYLAPDPEGGGLMLRDVGNDAGTSPTLH